jgi:hypothetical protein
MSAWRITGTDEVSRLDIGLWTLKVRCDFRGLWVWSIETCDWSDRPTPNSTHETREAAQRAAVGWARIHLRAALDALEDE